MKINGEVKLGEINLPAMEKMPALEQVIKNISISYSIEVSVGEMVNYAKALPEVTTSVIDSLKIAIKGIAECDELDELVNGQKRKEQAILKARHEKNQAEDTTTETKGD